MTLEESLSEGEDSWHTEGQTEDGEPSTKKKKLSDEEKVLRCRERNRIHARNTRERKKVQMEGMQQKLECLLEERASLSRQLLDTTVADILISLSSKPSSDSSSLGGTSAEDSSSTSSNPQDFYGTEELKSLQHIKTSISVELSDDDDLEAELELLNKDRGSCTTEELEHIRRERNRMHAKKTRLRKKKMLQEIELNVSKVEEEVKELRTKVKAFQLTKARELNENKNEKELNSLHIKDEINNNYNENQIKVEINNNNNITNSNINNSININKEKFTPPIISIGNESSCYMNTIMDPYNMMVYNTQGYHPSSVHQGYPDLGFTTPLGRIPVSVSLSSSGVSASAVSSSSQYHPHQYHPPPMSYLRPLNGSIPHPIHSMHPSPHMMTMHPHPQHHQSQHLHYQPPGVSVLPPTHWPMFPYNTAPPIPTDGHSHVHGHSHSHSHSRGPYSHPTGNGFRMTSTPLYTHPYPLYPNNTTPSTTTPIRREAFTQQGQVAAIAVHRSNEKISSNKTMKRASSSTS